MSRKGFSSMEQHSTYPVLEKLPVYDAEEQEIDILTVGCLNDLMGSSYETALFSLCHVFAQYPGEIRFLNEENLDRLIELIPQCPHYALKTATKIAKASDVCLAAMINKNFQGAAMNQLPDNQVPRFLKCLFHFDGSIGDKLLKDDAIHFLTDQLFANGCRTDAQIQIIKTITLFAVYCNIGPDNIRYILDIFAQRLQHNEDPLFVHCLRFLFVLKDDEWIDIILETEVLLSITDQVLSAYNEQKVLILNILMNVMLSSRYQILIDPILLNKLAQIARRSTDPSVIIPLFGIAENITSKSFDYCVCLVESDLFKAMLYLLNLQLLCAVAPFFRILTELLKRGDSEDLLSHFPAMEIPDGFDSFFSVDDPQIECALVDFLERVVLYPSMYFEDYPLLFIKSYQNEAVCEFLSSVTNPDLSKRVQDIASVLVSAL